MLRSPRNPGSRGREETGGDFLCDLLPKNMNFGIQTSIMVKVGNSVNETSG